MSKRNTATRRRSTQRPQHVTKSNVTPLYGSQSYSGTFDAQAEFVTEASLARQSKQNRSISLDWDETEGMNIDGSMRSSAGLSEQDRKDTLLQAYIQNCWISACVDVIAKRITSGGFAIEPIEQGKGDEAHRQALFDFCSLINENWDFLQFIRSIATDLLIYGECYVEIVRQGSVPVQLHKIDCMTMSYTLAQNGQITGYTQSVSHNNDPVEFEPDDIIRWWFPHPRASMKAMSPIERILNPTSADQKMVDWTHTFFRKGSKPPFWIETEGTEEDAKRFVKFMRENYTGVKNANAPVVTYGGAKLHEYNKSIIDIDFKSGRTMAREEILSVFGVPPALIGIIESGNIGGGTGDSQENSFRYNTVDPVRQMILEKLNYRVVKKGFNFDDWTIQTHYADYRSDDLVSKVQDTRLRNGMSTQNEERQAMGKHPYESMGDTPVFAVSKEVLPLDRLSELSDEQAQQSQIAISQAQAQLDMTKVQIDKAKNPPPPPPVVVAPGQPQTPANKSNNPPASPPPEEKEKQEHYNAELQRGIDRITELFVRADEHLQTVRSERSVLPALNTEEKRQLLEVWTTLKSVQSAREYFDALLPRAMQEDRPASEIMNNLAPQKEDSTVQVVINNEHSYSDRTTYLPYQQSSPVEDIAIVAPLEDEIKTFEPEAKQITLEKDIKDAPQIGIMIAFMLDPDTANQLAIPGGEAPDDMHCTLAYMGNIDDFDGDIERLKSTVANFAANAKGLQGEISGIGQFMPSNSSDGMTPVYASVDAPGLSEFRADLVRHLALSGFSIDRTHGFTPHVTLAFLPSQGGAND